MNDIMKRWEREDGVRFLKRIGITAGQRVVDFGARVGHYSIPAALVVGGAGVVYALDKERRELDELGRKARRLHLRNLKIVPTKDGVALDFEDGSVDVVLLYDVLHYLQRAERETLYRETHRILTADGFVSVYPKHVIEDSPLETFRDLHLSDVKREIQAQRFALCEEHCGSISHDDFLNRGCVYNFTKVNGDR